MPTNPDPAPAAVPPHEAQEGDTRECPDCSDRHLQMFDASKRVWLHIDNYEPLAELAAGRDAAPASPLSFEHFSAVNRERCESPSGFNHKLASWSTSDWFTAIVGELGEAANVAKKLNRIRDGIPGNKETEAQLHEKLRRELADAFVYLDLLAQALGFNIGAAAVDVFNTKSAEIGCPVTLRAEAPRPPVEPTMISANPNEKFHASAPIGYRCAECSMGDDPCPRCYLVWWERTHPNVQLIDSKLDTLRAPTVEAAGRPPVEQSREEPNTDLLLAVEQVVNQFRESPRPTKPLNDALEYLCEAYEESKVGEAGRTGPPLETWTMHAAHGGIVDARCEQTGEIVDGEKGEWLRVAAVPQGGDTPKEQP